MNNRCNHCGMFLIECLRCRRNLHIHEFTNGPDKPCEYCDFKIKESLKAK